MDPDVKRMSEEESKKYYEEKKLAEEINKKS